MLTLGKPEHHEDGPSYSNGEFFALETSLRPFACKIVEKMDPKIFLPHYNEQNKKSPIVVPKAVDFGHPSQRGVGGSSSTGPTLSTPIALAPA